MFSVKRFLYCHDSEVFTLCIIFFNCWPVIPTTPTYWKLFSTFQSLLLPATLKLHHFPLCSRQLPAPQKQTCPLSQPHHSSGHFMMASCSFMTCFTGELILVSEWKWGSNMRMECKSCVRLSICFFQSD